VNAEDGAGPRRDRGLDPLRIDRQVGGADVGEHRRQPRHRDRVRRGDERKRSGDHFAFELGGRDRGMQRNRPVADDGDPLGLEEAAEGLLELQEEGSLIGQNPVRPDLLEQRYELIQIRQIGPGHVDHFSQRQFPPLQARPSLRQPTICD